MIALVHHAGWSVTIITIIASLAPATKATVGLVQPHTAAAAMTLEETVPIGHVQESSAVIGGNQDLHINHLF